jgi:Ca2+/Na+ antiporter
MCPIRTGGWETLIALAAGVSAVLIILPGRSGGIGRIRGLGLLIVYLAYVAMVLHQ